MSTDISLTLDHLRQVRANLLALIETKTPDQLNAIPAGFNNNLIWNAGHVVATSELLVYALGGHRTPSGRAFIDRYRKDSKPEGPVDQEEIDFIKTELLEGPLRIATDYAALDWSNYKPYTTSFGIGFSTVEEALNFNNMHEAMHFGTMLGIRNIV